MKAKDAQRFIEKIEVDPVTGCWNWTRAKSRKGYGQFKLEGKRQLAHRVSYKIFAGSIAEGHELHHECVNPGCVNYLHLKSVTHEEHIAIHATQK